SRRLFGQVGLLGDPRDEFAFVHRRRLLWKVFRCCLFGGADRIPPCGIGSNASSKTIRKGNGDIRQEVAALDGARVRSMVVLAIVLLLALGAFYLVSGRQGGGPQGTEEARGEEPNVTLVHEDGRRERMPMEEYVKGVVAGEMGRLPARGETEEQDWPEAAYAAQAILARSFAVRYLEESGGDEIPAQHEAAQAYNPDNIIPAIERGVERTRGEVMVYNGEPVRAWFHSYSGGRTATAREGLAQ